VLKNYLLLLDQTILLQFRSSIDRPLNLPQYPGSNDYFYLKLESTDGQAAKVDFNPSSSKSSYQDLPEEERQKIKDLLFILENYRELTVFCDGLPRTYLVSSMPGRY
jgi:hypothetical protein